MPVVGALVQSDDGKGKVVEVNPLLEQIKVEFQDKTVKIYTREDIKILREPKNVMAVVVNVRIMMD